MYLLGARSSLRMSSPRPACEHHSRILQDGGGYLYRDGCAPGAGRAGTATWVLVDQGEWSGAEWQWRWWEEGKRQAKSTRVQRRDLGHTRETGAKTGRSNRAAGDNNSNRHVRCMYRVPNSRWIFYQQPWYWVRCIMLCGGTKGLAGSGDGDGERVSCMEPWFGARLGRASCGGWSRYSGQGSGQWFKVQRRSSGGWCSYMKLFSC